VQGGADCGVGGVHVGVHEVEHGLDGEGEVATDVERCCVVFLGAVSGGDGIWEIGE
jgi:hypothetical protein